MLRTSVAPRRPRYSPVLAVFATAGLLAAQVPLPLGDGYRATEVFAETTRPTGFAGFAPGLVDGTIHFAIDHAVFTRDAAGAITLVHAFASTAYCDVLVRPPGSTLLFYGDDQHAELRVRDLTTGAETLRASLPHTFDLVRTVHGDVLVSANPAWPTAGAHPGIWWLDPQGTNHRELVALTGASGPLVLDPRNGDVICATASAAFPPPPGAVTILRFAAAQIAAARNGGPTLTASDATVVASGIDGAFDLAFDDRGALFATNALDGRVERIDAQGRLDPMPFVAATGQSALGVWFVDGSPATFAPYQPDDGGALWVATTDWATRASVHAVRAFRPRATSRSGATAGPGTLVIEHDGLPPLQPAFLLFNPLPLLTPEPILPVQATPLFCALDFLVPPLAFVAAADASGRMTAALPYNGGSSLTIAFQTAAWSPDGSLVTSTPLTVTLLY